ncbi:type II toxin-antitoxin system VapB family antitoxin [Nostoc sp. CMAA1605]|uniref:type II toxin-antitoxin system VapB family antitoxin n=1 Tax=Nostoc sp. CMAA1605 TaxID=2055159 RepID=UPI001F44CD27|nr:DUF2281 domain-containing protein [Nostoc sp. CMAA1605]MCF4966265.1 hypothetical protein [Nostoc sp. CMAA1605]
MNTDAALWQAVLKMPDVLKTELLHYAEYLLANYPNLTKPTEKLEKQHGYGSWATQIIMSDDFDEPLADLEEYM